MSRIVLRGASVFDGERRLEGPTTVVVEGRRITVVAPDSQVPTQPGDREVPLAGRTVMPGMVTCHFHSTYKNLGSSARPFGLEEPPAYAAYVAAENARTCLLAGWTGAVGASCTADVDASLRRAIDEGMLLGPRLVPSSRDIITTSDSNDVGPWWWELGAMGAWRTADGPDEFRRAVRDEVRRGAEMVKLYVTGGHGVLLPKSVSSLTPDELHAAVEAAHARGVRIRGHVVAKEWILRCVAEGMDVVDHADEMDAECIEAFVAAGTFVVPSLLLPWRIMAMPGMDDRMGFVDGVRHDFDRVAALLAEADEAGVKLVVGDDYGALGLPHGEYSDELALYVEHAGVSPVDVLRWATRNGAECLGRGHDLGRIAEDRLADLLVVDGDPTADIGVLRKPDALLAILKDGVLVKDALPAG